MSNPPGYPLPDGELGDDDIVCQLVFLPDRPEYWQAFISAIHYFATWKAWERDGGLRGKDAAANWRAANELTMECWRMACLQDLQDNVAEILAIMQLGNQCCDDQDITGGDRYTDRVEDGVGLVPQNIVDAGYASSTSDWAAFDDYKCMISHVTVNQMEARLREIDEVVDSAGPYLALAAALSAIVGVIVTAGGLAIVFGMLAGIGVVSALYYALIEFGPVGDLADAVATNHDELACAVYNADGDEGALVALNDKIDELFTAPEALVLTNINLGPTLKALYAGRYDQQDIADILDTAGYETGDFSCNCDIINLNGWILDEQTAPAIYQHRGSSGCESFTWPKWNIFESPDGASLTSGHFRIKGYFLCIGDIDLTGCESAGQMQAGYRIDFDWDAPDKSFPSTIFEFPYSNMTDHPGGAQNYRWDFEWEGDRTNVRWMNFKSRITIRYHEVDLDFITVITEIEVT